MQNVMKRGFTLIELLVVIAIIGILAAVVLASLGDARDNGRNASTQGSMNSIRNQMELLYNASGTFTYDTACADTSLDDLKAAIQNNSPATSVVVDGAAQVATTLNCNDTADAWAASAPLQNVTGTQQYFCVDSTGVARTSTTPLASAATTGNACP